MNTAIQDAIEREVMIQAPKERVYSAITDPDQIIVWFPDVVEGKLEAGEEAVFGFGEYGKYTLLIIASDPYDYFAYRWVPGSGKHCGFIGDVNSRPNTLVEFRLESQGTGTLVKVKESGFAGLLEHAEEIRADHESGWTQIVAGLERFVTKS